MLTDAQQRALVEIARAAVTRGDHGDPRAAPTAGDLDAARGHRRVRHAEARRPAARLHRHPRVPAAAGRGDRAGRRRARRARIRASTRRRPTELDDLDVEVSVLGPLEAIDPRDPDAIDRSAATASSSNGARIAGCCCRRSRPSGDGRAMQFLAQTCTKAGLAEDALAARRQRLSLRGGRLRRLQQPSQDVQVASVERIDVARAAASAACPPSASPAASAASRSADR